MGLFDPSEEIPAPAKELTGKLITSLIEWLQSIGGHHEAGWGTIDLVDNDIVLEHTLDWQGNKKTEPNPVAATAKRATSYVRRNFANCPNHPSLTLQDFHASNCKTLWVNEAEELAWGYDEARSGMGGIPFSWAQELIKIGKYKKDATLVDHDGTETWVINSSY